MRDQPSQQVIKAATSKDVPSGGPAGSGVPNEGITPMSGHSGLTRHASSQSELFHTPKSSPVPSPPPSPPMPRPPPTVGCIVGCWPRVSKVDTFFSRVIHKCVSVLYVHVCGHMCVVCGRKCVVCGHKCVSVVMVVVLVSLHIHTRHTHTFRIRYMFTSPFIFQTSFLICPGSRT